MIGVLIPSSPSTGVEGIGVVGRLMLFGWMTLGLGVESLQAVVSITSMGTVAWLWGEKSVDEDDPAASMDTILVKDEAFMVFLMV